MTLAPQSRIGPYEIVEAIGAGGMGEVYRARDTRLGREVAIKVCNEQFTERFEREARAVAALNHPNICTLHDVGPNYLVMELVEGEVPQGPMPLAEALQIAEQIAEALGESHEKGITHRDLKPGNIKIKPDGTVKVLDFGLAKVAPAASGGSPGEDSSTLAGTILGTAGYMAPEQARGKNVDRRADIWAFGVVLYEMLTGRRLFKGEDLTDTLALVLKEQPDLAAAPAQVQRLLKSCLEKDPRKRLQAIGDWKLLLDEPPASAKGLSYGRSLWPAGVLALALATLAVIYFREVPPAERALSLSIPFPTNSSVGHLALSPDGRSVVMNIYVEGQGQLWLRSLDSPEMRSLPGTGNGRVPFWSPNGREIGFFADRKLKTVLASGGLPQTLCDVGQNGGGAWSREGVILFAADSGPIQQVPAVGGECKPLTTAAGGSFHRYPSFLPDGRHFLYTVDGGEESQRGVYLAALNDPAGRRILTDRSSAFFTPSIPGSSKGHLIFLRESSLMAQPFDAESLQLAGDPFPIARDASFSYSAPQAAAAASENGLLIYLANSAISARDFQLVKLDRKGNELAKVGEPGMKMKVALSPDGKTAAVQRLDGPGQTSSIWLREIRGLETRFTFSPLAGAAPVWSPDRSHMAFSSSGNLYRKEIGGSGQEEMLLESPSAKFPSSWAPDGRLVYTEIDTKTRADLWMLPDPLGKTGENKPVPFLRTEASESQGQVSPDGRWIAFASNKSGQFEIYVRPFPSGAGEWPVTGGRGDSREPRWSHDGGELFYTIGFSPVYELWSMPVLNGAQGGFAVGTPAKLFQFRGLATFAEANEFMYSPFDDGQSFLVVIQTGEIQATLNVITNWRRRPATP